MEEPTGFRSVVHVWIHDHKESTLTLITKSEFDGNLLNVQRHICVAARKAGRSPDDITLVAVTKGWPVDVVRVAIEAGVRDIGENRVQEAEAKLSFSMPNVRYHLVGHLQKNKARRAARLFDVIHSVESVELGTRLSKAAIEHRRTLQLLVQVNVAEDDAKFGITEQQTSELVRALGSMDGIEVVGLMTIGPLVSTAEESRPCFRRLRELRDALRSTNMKLEHLSMGMTADYQVAIEEGATMVRVGTALFGHRQT